MVIGEEALGMRDEIECWKAKCLFSSDVITDKKSGTRCVCVQMNSKIHVYVCVCIYICIVFESFIFAIQFNLSLLFPSFIS